MWLVMDDPSGVPGVAPLPATNQKACYDALGVVIDCAGTGQDGELQKGIPMPVPRFIDQGDGTIHDRSTGLVWLKQADCFAAGDLTAAYDAANHLADGQCNLTDGSAAGDWRLPNFHEMFSLLDISRGYPALSDTLGTGHYADGDPFTGVPFNLHWTSTAKSPDHDGNWTISPYANGNIHGSGNLERMWPVRDPLP